MELALAISIFLFCVGAAACLTAAFIKILVALSAKD